MRYFLTKAIILKRQVSGENDWYLTMFSPEFGMLRAVARGSRKIASHQGPHLDTLNLCQFQLYRNANRLLITDCKVEKNYLEIKNDLQKSLLGFTIIELLLRSIQEDSPNPELFELTKQSLDNLARESSELHLEEFKIKLLKEAGSWPDVSLCYFCQNKCHVDQPLFCDCEGHLSCPSCQHNCHSGMNEINFQTIKLAKFLADKNHLLVNLKITPEQLYGLKKLTTIFMQNYLRHEINSEKLLYC